MKIRRMTSVLLALTLWTAGTAFASSASDHFPVSPAAWDETCISQEEAVAAAKDAMEQQGTPYVEMDGKVKAGFVQLENGENAWVVMLDSALKTDAVVTVSPAGDILYYQSTDEASPEIYTIMLEDWRAAKGGRESWSVEDYALFQWLFGSADAYVAPEESDISQEKAIEIALEAVPEELSDPSCTVLFSTYYKDASLRVWHITVCEHGEEVYIVYVAAEDGKVIEAFPVSNFG